MSIKVLNNLSSESNKIAEVLFSTPATTLTVSGLYIPADTLITVDFRMSLAASITTDVSCFINGDTTTTNYHNKREKYITTSATTEAQLSEAKILTGVTTASWGGLGHARVELVCGYNGTYYNYNASAIHSDVWANYEGHVRYTQATNVITSISFVSSISNALSGTVIVSR